MNREIFFNIGFTLFFIGWIGALLDLNLPFTERVEQWFAFALGTGLSLMLACAFLMFFDTSL